MTKAAFLPEKPLISDFPKSNNTQLYTSKVQRFCRTKYTNNFSKVKIKYKTITNNYRPNKRKKEGNGRV